VRRAGWRAQGLHDRAPLPADPSDCLPLPPDARAALEGGLAAMGLRDLPAPRVAALEGHLRLLLAWTGAVNLTAIRDPRAAVAAHVLDALSAVGLLRDEGVRALLDLGSGGGYPGLPLAIALPAERAGLVESIAKKARFLEAAVAGLGLAGRVDVARERAESLAADPRHRERWPAVTARRRAAGAGGAGLPAARAGRAPRRLEGLRDRGGAPPGDARPARARRRDHRDPRDGTAGSGGARAGGLPQDGPHGPGLAAVPGRAGTPSLVSGCYAPR
jgi:16S rRNA (guanine(527)-N(7))-methyltransferase RsmG